MTQPKASKRQRRRHEASMPRAASAGDRDNTAHQPISCRAPGCISTELCNAHIIPKGFARDILTASNHNLTITAQGPKRAKPQLGEYDPGILCAECDRKLGELDQYGLEVCRRFEKVPVKVGVCSFLQDVDGDRFALFALSVIWRASISKRSSWRKASLGSFERLAAEVIFGLKPLSALPAYQLILFRYAHELGPPRFYSSPHRERLVGLNTIGFTAGGLRMVAKFDQRRFAPALERVVVNGADRLVALGVSIFSGPDARLFLDAMQAAGGPRGVRFKL